MLTILDTLATAWRTEVDVLVPYARRHVDRCNIQIFVDAELIDV